MHIFDVIGFHYEGAAYCPDCFTAEPAPSPEDMEANGGVIFAEYEYDFIGSTCSTCQACYGPSGWSESNCDASQWRWSCCPSCNSQRPYDKGDAGSRLEALRGDLQCVSCHKPTHF